MGFFLQRHVHAVSFDGGYNCRRYLALLLAPLSAAKKPLNSRLGNYFHKHMLCIVEILTALASRRVQDLLPVYRSPNKVFLQVTPLDLCWDLSEKLCKKVVVYY